MTLQVGAEDALADRVAALATWVVTAGFGSPLFITWLARGGVTQHPRGRRLTVRLPPP